MVSDNLRTRIAAVLYKRWWHRSMTLNPPPRWEKLTESARETWLTDADAVIAELETHYQLVPKSELYRKLFGA